MLNQDPLETALVLGAAGAVGAIVGFIAGAGAVLAIVIWYVT